MKMKKLLVLVAVFMVGIFSTPLFAQGGFNWPPDETLAQSAKEKYVLHTDSRKMGDYTTAHSTLVWLLKNTPELSESLYISGYKVFEEMADVEESEKRKYELQDSALLLYDLRAKYYGNEASILNRKLLQEYKYYANRPNKLQGLVDDYTRLFEIAPISEINDYHMLTYMDAVRRNQKNNGGSLTDPEIMAIYDKVMAVYEEKMSTAKNKPQLEEMKGQIDGILADMVTIDCNFIDTQLGDKLRANPTDLEMAKKIFSYSITASCTDTDIFTQAAKVYYESEPQLAVARVLANRAIKEENYDEGLKYLNDAIEMSEDNAEQGELTMRIADIASFRNEKGKARELYLKAAQIDPSLKEAYSKVGDLILGSYDQCKKEQSRVDDRAIFIAAYEYYVRGGNGQRAAQMKEQFPTAEMIFTEGRAVGEEVRVGCWIGMTVKIQKAD